MARTFHFAQAGETRSVHVEQEGAHCLVRVGERTFAIAATVGDAGRLDLDVAGARRRVFAVRQGDRTYVWLDGEVWTLTKTDLRLRRAQPTAQGALDAAMPGRVLDVLVAPGDVVQRGATLLLLEAMKMELRIQAPADGTVVQVHVSPGAVVERGQLLVTVV